MPLEERLAQPRQQHALPLRERLDTHIAHGRRDLAGARRARCAFAHTLGSGGDGGRAACLATQGEEVRHRYYRPNIATSVIEAALASQQGGRASWADRVEQLTAEGSKGRRVHAVALTRVALRAAAMCMGAGAAGRGVRGRTHACSIRGSATHCASALVAEVRTYARRLASASSSASSPMASSTAAACHAYTPR
eukprot:3871194-Prymnesium_polylepis.1